MDFEQLLSDEQVEVVVDDGDEVPPQYQVKKQTGRARARVSCRSENAHVPQNSQSTQFTSLF